MTKLKKDNILNFPNNISEADREIEARNYLAKAKIEKW